LRRVAAGQSLHYRLAPLEFGLIASLGSARLGGGVLLHVGIGGRGCSPLRLGLPQLVRLVIVVHVVSL
jgi:hypothetical protein